MDATLTFFQAILAATTPEQVAAALASVGDSASVDIRVPFGSLSLRWEPFGDNLSNISSVGLGTKPGRSLTERLTNGIDAVLEDRASRGGALPDSSRMAAQQWFGRPVTGPDDGLYRWGERIDQCDRLLSVVLLPSGSEGAPTVDVIDKGVGIAPEDFRRTILSLQAGNKLTKRYLIGAFGQGGAATLGFCQYAIIISRTRKQPEVVGFTVIRVMRLSDEYKEDAYAYLACTVHGEVVVPRVQVTEPLELFSASGKVRKPPILEHGTLVRHIQYKLPNLAGSLSPSPGNLYQYLHCSMFDPLLPFRAIDLRDPEKARDERITGSRNRLMRLVELKGARDDDEAGGRIEIRHHRPMEYFSLHPGETATTGIEYWVVNHLRKSKKGDKQQLVLRSNSIDSFVQPTHPIVGTLNGQNQGELTARIFKELGLGMVSRHVVVHVDVSNTTPRLRRELFSTNREGFKDGDVLTELQRILGHMIEEDSELKVIEQELTDRLTKRENEETNKEVQSQISQLLRDAGFEVKAEGRAPTAGDLAGDPASAERRKRRRYSISIPLPTLPFPGVSFFKIVSPRPAMDVAIGDSEILLVETDADAMFDKQGRIALRCEPAFLEEFGKSPLKGGRARWRLRPVPNAVAGQIGKVVATITKPDGSQLTDELQFKVSPQRHSVGKMDKGLVPPFRVIPVSPEEEEKWTSLWPNLGDEVSEEAQAAVAYKPLNVNGEIHVYYSTVFKDYRSTLEKLKGQEAGLAQFFDNGYQVWIGYHAILQENAKKQQYDGIDIDPDKLEALLDEDRIRVAQMQVKQAVQWAKLKRELLKSKTEVE